MTEYAARGTLLQVDTTGGGAWQTVAQLATVDLNMTRDEIQVSNHDTSDHHRYVGGLANTEVPFEVLYDPDAVSHNENTNGLSDLYRNATSRNWRILMNALAGTPAITFTAIVREFNLRFPSEGEMRGAGVLRVSSQPNLP